MKKLKTAKWILANKNIKTITSKEFKKMLSTGKENYLSNPDYEPKGLFICEDKKAEVWLMIDNSKGNALTEEFYNFRVGLNWLIGELDLDEAQELDAKKKKPEAAIFNEETIVKASGANKYNIKNIYVLILFFSGIASIIMNVLFGHNSEVEKAFIIVAIMLNLLIYVILVMFIYCFKLDAWIKVSKEKKGIYIPMVQIMAVILLIAPILSAMLLKYLISNGLSDIILEFFANI